MCVCVCRVKICYPSLQEWNEDLAYLAQFWASACEYVENEDRNTQSTTFDYIGESFAATVSYTVNYTQLIGQLWYGEKRSYNYYAAACLDEDGNADEDGEFETCGRYTQVSMQKQYDKALHCVYADGVGPDICCWLWSFQMC